MHLNRKIYEKLIFWKTVEALVIILTWYVKPNETMEYLGRQGQVCFLIHLNGNFFWKVDFLNTVEAKVIILTWYVQSSIYK